MARPSTPQNSKLLQKIEQQREQSKQQTRSIMSEQQRRLKGYTDSALRELHTTLSDITQSLARVQAQTIPTERAIRELTETVEALDRANRRANSRPLWHWALAIILTCAAISAGSWAQTLWQSHKLEQLHQLQGAAWLEHQDGEIYLVIAREYRPKKQVQTLENGDLRFQITNNKAAREK